MNGKKRGVMILKKGGEFGNVGGNRISNIIEFILLLSCLSGALIHSNKSDDSPTLHIFGYWKLRV